MKIVRPKHRGIRRLIEDGDASGLPARSVDKITEILESLQNMRDASELHRLPNCKPQGNQWNLSVKINTRNYRITFRVDRVKGEVVDLDFKD